MKIICGEQYQIFEDYINSGKRTRSAMQKVAKQLDVPISQIQHMTECVGRMVEALERQVSPLATDMNAKPINGSMGLIQCPLCYTHPELFDSLKTQGYLTKNDGFIPITCCIGEETTLGGVNRAYDVWDETTGYIPKAKCKYISNEPYVMRFNPKSSAMTDPLEGSSMGVLDFNTGNSQNTVRMTGPSNLYRKQTDTIKDEATGETTQIEEKVSRVNKSQVVQLDKSAVGGTGRFTDIGNAIEVFINCMYVEQQKEGDNEGSPLTNKSPQLQQIKIPINRSILKYYNAINSENMDKVDEYEDAIFDIAYGSIPQAIGDYANHYIQALSSNQPVTNFNTIPLDKIRPLFEKAGLTDLLGQIMKRIIDAKGDFADARARTLPIPIKKNIATFLQSSDKTIYLEDIVDVLVSTITAEQYQRKNDSVPVEWSRLGTILDSTVIDHPRFQQAVETYREWYHGNTASEWDKLSPDEMFQSLDPKMQNLYAFGDAPLRKTRQGTLRRIVAQQLNKDSQPSFDSVWQKLPPEIKTMFDPRVLRDTTQLLDNRSKERSTKIINLLQQIVKDYKGKNPPPKQVAMNKLQSLAASFFVDDILQAVRANDPSADLSNAYISSNTIRQDRDLMQTAVKKYLGTDIESAISHIMGDKAKEISVEDAANKVLYKKPVTGVPGMFEYIPLSRDDAQKAKTKERKKKSENPKDIADESQDTMTNIDIFHGDVYDRSGRLIAARVNYIKNEFFKRAPEIFDMIQKQYIKHKSLGQYDVSYDTLMPDVAHNLQGTIKNLLKSSDDKYVDTMIDQLQSFTHTIFSNENIAAIKDKLKSGDRNGARKQIDQLLHQIGIDTPTMMSAWISFIHSMDMPGKTGDGKNVTISQWLHKMDQSNRAGGRINQVKDAQSDQVNITQVIKTDAEYEKAEQSGVLPAYLAFAPIEGEPLMHLYAALHKGDEVSVYSENSIDALANLYTVNNTDEINERLAEFQRAAGVELNENDIDKITRAVSADRSLLDPLSANQKENIKKVAAKADIDIDTFLADIDQIHQTMSIQDNGQSVLKLCKSYSLDDSAANEILAITQSDMVRAAISDKTKSLVESIISRYYKPTPEMAGLVDELNKLNTQYSITPKLRENTIKHVLQMQGYDNSNRVIELLDVAPRVSMRVDSAHREELKTIYQQLDDVVAESSAPVSTVVLKGINNGPSDQALNIVDKIERLSDDAEDRALYLWGAPESSIFSLAPKGIKVVTDADGTKKFFDDDAEAIRQDYLRAIIEYTKSNDPEAAKMDDASVIEHYSALMMDGKTFDEIASTRWGNSFSAYKRTANELVTKDQSWDAAARYAQDNVDLVMSMQVSRADPKHIQMLNAFVNADPQIDPENYNNVYAQIYSMVYPMVKGWVVKNVSNQSIKDDVAEDTVSEVMDYLRTPQTTDASGRKLSKFRGSGSLKSYLFQIIEHKVIDQLRKRGYNKREISADSMLTALGSASSGSVYDQFIGLKSRAYDRIANASEWDAFFKSITTQLNANPTRALPALFAMMSQGNYTQIAHSLGMDPNNEKDMSYLRSTISDMFSRVGSATSLAGNTLEQGSSLIRVDKSNIKTPVVKLQPGVMVDVRLGQDNPARLLNRMGEPTNQYADTTIKIPGCQVVSADTDSGKVQVQIPIKTVYVGPDGEVVKSGTYVCPQHGIRLEKGTTNPQFQICSSCKDAQQIIKNDNGQWKAGKPARPELAGVVDTSVAIPLEGTPKRVPDFDASKLGTSQYDQDQQDQTGGIPLSRDRSVAFAQKIIDEQDGVFEVDIHQLTYAGTDRKVQTEDTGQDKIPELIRQYVRGVMNGMLASNRQAMADMAAQGLSEITDTSSEHYSQLQDNMLPLIRQFLENDDRISVNKIISDLPVLGDEAVKIEEEVIKNKEQSDKGKGLTNRPPTLQEPDKEPDKEPEQQLTNRFTAPVSEVTESGKDIAYFEELLQRRVLVDKTSAEKASVGDLANEMEPSQAVKFLKYARIAMLNRAEASRGQIDDEKYNNYIEQLNSGFDRLIAEQEKRKSGHRQAADGYLLTNTK